MAKDSRQKEIEAQIDAMSAEIKKLKAEADKASAEARGRMYEEIRRLETQEDEAREQMRKMRQAGAGAFEDMMKGAEQAWKSLAESVDKARKRFK